MTYKRSLNIYVYINIHAYVQLYICPDANRSVYTYTYVNIEVHAILPATR